MIQATVEHRLTLVTTDEKTAGLANMVHNMGAWLSDELITKDTFVQVHNILRQELDIENFISLVHFEDKREESNEYTIVIVEFPEKSDGTIRSMTVENGKLFLLTEEEAIENATQNNTDKKGNN